MRSLRLSRILIIAVSTSGFRITGDSRNGNTNSTITSRNGNLPALELMRLGGDHFGDFARAIDGVNTVETQMAANDYALGLVIEKIAHSPYKNDTLVFVVEDDAQDGPDHVEAHQDPGVRGGSPMCGSAPWFPSDTRPCTFSGPSRTSWASSLSD